MKNIFKIKTLKAKLMISVAVLMIVVVGIFLTAVYEKS